MCYKSKDCYLHRKVAGNDILISVGENVVNFNGYVDLSPTAAFLWDKLSEPRSCTQLIDAVLDEYNTDPLTAKSDVNEFLQTLVLNNMVIIMEKVDGKT